jgi:hypothetical protein
MTDVIRANYGVCVQGLLNLPTFALTRAQGILNHPVYSQFQITFATKVMGQATNKKDINICLDVCKVVKLSCIKDTNSVIKPLKKYTRSPGFL